jgi:FG-GAP repeat
MTKLSSLASVQRLVVLLIFVGSSVPSYGLPPSEPIKFFEEAKLFPPTGQRRNGVGRAVDLMGNRAIVGAIGSGDGGGPFDAAFVFERDAKGWSYSQELIPSVVQASTATFGISVAIDGPTAIVGADLDGEQIWQSGAVYIFEEGPFGFSQSQKVYHPHLIMDGNFGRAIAKDGDTLIVGAPGLTGGTPRPTAYAFTRQNDLWTLQSELVPVVSANTIETFGYSVDVDGDFAAVGDEGDYNQGFFHRGAARIFQRTGSAWTETQHLTAFDSIQNHGFGEAISISGDTIAIGAPGDDDLGDLAGAIYIYRFNGEIWNLEQKIRAADGQRDDSFGRQLSLNGDLLVVGVEPDDDRAFDGGAVYVFERNGVTWSQTAKLFSSDINTSDYLGQSIALGDGQFIVGASNAEPFGAAYVFVIPEPSTLLLVWLTALSIVARRSLRT